MAEEEDTPTEEALRTFIDLIKSRRRAKKLQQKELAQAIGKAASYVNHLEAGRRVPSVEVLLLLARELDIAPATLLGLLRPSLAGVVSGHMQPPADGVRVFAPEPGAEHTPNDAFYEWLAGQYSDLSTTSAWVVGSGFDMVDREGRHRGFAVVKDLCAFLERGHLFRVNLTRFAVHGCPQGKLWVELLLRLFTDADLCPKKHKVRLVAPTHPSALSAALFRDVAVFGSTRPDGSHSGAVELGLTTEGRDYPGEEVIDRAFVVHSHKMAHGTRQLLGDYFERVLRGEVPNMGVVILDGQLQPQTAEKVRRAYFCTSPNWALEPKDDARWQEDRPGFEQQSQEIVEEYITWLRQMD